MKVECIPTREDMKPWVKVVPDMMDIAVLEYYLPRYFVVALASIQK